jgi:O-succinylbenzoic acid--CoA ligase
MTEASSMITLNGRVLPHLELKIGSEQEIMIRGKSVFAGYLKSDGTIESPLKEGWLHTKDRGIIREGKLEFIGRKDRMFISGGENIQPEEIEEAIHSLFKVDQAMIVPYEDIEFGMRPAAYIFAPEQSLTLELLQGELKKILPKYKIPQKLFNLSRPYEKHELKNLV